MCNTAVLIQAADPLNVPLNASEQYPNGIGSTETGVALHFPEDLAVVDKPRYFCTDNAQCSDILTANNRRQVLLTGMETYVCVLQTALGLRADG